MRDRKTVLLESKKFARENRLLSWWHLASSLAVFVVLVVLAASDFSIAIRLPASFLLGLTMVRIFVIYHDHQHGSILAGSRLADWIMRAWGLAVLNPPSIWNRSHEHHHRNNAKIYGASIGSYPVMTAAAYSEASRGQRLMYAATRHPLTIALGYVTIFLYGMCLRSFQVSPRRHADSLLSILIHLSLVITLAIVSPAALLFAVVIPMLLASALGAYLFYAQHNYPSVKIQGRAEWDYLDAALYSSSYTEMGPILRWFTGNIGFHHVHHLNARIPFYRLPETMRAIPELQSPGRTSLSLADIRSCLRLKLWDELREEMVPFSRAEAATVTC